ncbi:uncharacterized protein LOC134790898 [Cydia splendana]|uniref:uncharacterized protein LOC134790898 n=1 Tax=Cydia splendana TaxID=1100963 RepID=UPI0028F487BE
MSPLARSLLALAALLAAADAQGYNCVTKDVGQVTNDPVILPDVNIPYPGGQVILPKHGMCPYDAQPVGERIVCCNNRPYNNQPEIVGPVPPSLSPFNVMCHDLGGCKCRITVYCPN